MDGDEDAVVPVVADLSGVALSGVRKGARSLSSPNRLRISDISAFPSDLLKLDWKSLVN